MTRMLFSKHNFVCLPIILLVFGVFTSGCTIAGSARTSKGDAIGGDATTEIKTGDILSPEIDISPNISPKVELEIKDSLKDLVDVGLGDSAINAIIEAAGDYFTGGAGSIAKAAVKGVEAATEEKPDLTGQQKEKIKDILTKNLEKDIRNKDKE